MTELHADCARCAGLCCVAPGFTASADFAISKKPGQACPHLRTDFGCEIHDRLRPLGFPGCTTFDCYGAGQQVIQVTFEGRNWRSDPELAAAQFASFAVMRQLHEMRWHVTQALALTRGLGDGQLLADLTQADQTLRGHADSSPAALAALDVDPLWATTTAVLRRASQLIRGDVPPGRERSGADLMGRHLAGVDLRRASLRGAYLIGTNLAGADLRLADLAGADLRGAQLAGADLSTSLFLTQAQLDAARGDARTKLPPALRHPAHWPGPAPRPSGGR
ncbi:MAG TPA: pentapeptide repeat-containing protein [Streptosporangiaceae bacterium]|nr:pentapeptide repeat-containing protein [Streptosporangiaceae bacterium]